MFSPDQLEKNLDLWDVNPSKTIHVINLERLKHLEIYTDASKTGTGLGLAFVVYEKGKEIYVWQATLFPDNSLFQVEMLELTKADQWKNMRKKNYRLLTDSLSSILALNTPFSRNHAVGASGLN